MEIKQLRLSVTCANTVHTVGDAEPRACERPASYMVDDAYACTDCTIALLREQIHQLEQRLQVKQEGPLNAVVPLLTCGVCNHITEHPESGTFEPYGWCTLLDQEVGDIHHPNPKCPLRKGKS